MSCLSILVSLKLHGRQKSLLRMCFMRAVGSAPTKSESIPQALIPAVIPDIMKSIAPEALKIAMATNIATK